MTTRNRSPVTPRKRRLWTVQNVALTLTAAAAGTGSQAIVDLGGAFTSSTGLALRNATVARTFIKGFALETFVVSPVAFQLCLGLMVAQSTLDAGEFPSIGTGRGDYFVRDCRSSFEPAAAPSIVLPEGVPNGGGNYDIDGKSKRMIRREFEAPFVVAQKDVATEADVVLNLGITLLWLY